MAISKTKRELADITSCSAETNVVENKK